jgi:hypothetical protein
MNTLQRVLEALQWQGGTYTQIRNEVRSLNIPQNEAVYRWGLREGEARRHGSEFIFYPIPHNSWEQESNSYCTLAYVKGVIDGLAQSNNF